MASVAEDRRGISIGRVFSQAFAAIRSNPATFFGLTFLVGALPSVAWSYVEGPMGLNIADGVRRSGGVAALVGMQIISFLISMFLAMLVQGALVRATVAHAEGREATLVESAGAGARAALPLFVLLLLTVIGVAAGMMLLLVPGIILYIMWSVAAPVLVEERRGVFESFGRSRALTKGARWHIFGLDVVVWIVIWIITAAYGVILFAVFGLGGLQNLSRTAQAGFPIGFLVGQVVLSTIVTVFWSATQNALYVELRRWKDGFTPERLADVFA